MDGGAWWAVVHGVATALGRSLGGGNDNPIPVVLPENLHGQRSLARYSPQCQTLCNPMDYSLPGSSVHGIL